MYILKNAFRCISRAKGRNILIGLVVLLLSVSSCIELSIKEANRTLKKQYADDMEISATVNPKEMRNNRNTIPKGILWRYSATLQTRANA